MCWLPCRKNMQKVLSKRMAGKSFVPSYTFPCIYRNNFLTKANAPDAFATERKHRYFKNTVANSIRRISDFTSAALLKLTEYEINVHQPAEKLFTQLSWPQHEMSTIASYCGAKKSVGRFPRGTQRCCLWQRPIPSDRFGFGHSRGWRCRN